MTSRARVTLIAATILGLAVTAYATYVHVNLLRNPGFAPACDINATFNCTSAYLSAIRIVCRSAGRAAWRVVVRIDALPAHQRPGLRRAE